MPENIDREGSPFILAKKRTQTYLSRGMTLAESSPGHEVLDPKWKPSSTHEAPPTRGVLSLFNQGDRRRWYWPCSCCGEYFMPAPGIEAFSFNKNVDLFGVTDTTITGVVGLVCTECGEVIEEKEKTKMNAGGVWVPEGCRIEREGKTHGLVGDARKSTIASYWMPGAAAAYQSWRSIVQNYLNALREYDITGSEESLKATTNVDQGAPYLPKRLMSQTSSSDIEKRAEDLKKRMVPEGVRFLVATVDVQAAKFVVQVEGKGVDNESWLIDRFDIHISKRTSGGEPLPLDPAGYIEDWSLITEKVIKRTYPLADGSGHKMAILRTGCDSGGKAGVTDRAYDYWRSLKKYKLHDRFILLKGERPRPNARKPTVLKSFPDNTNRKDRKASARGDVPVWILNTTLLKDSVSADLKRTEPGARYMHFPDWLSFSFYEELTAEVRLENGWDNPLKARNETFDLYAYSKGVVYALIIDSGMQAIDWDSPPHWAREWNNNSQVDFIVEEKTVTRSRSRVINKGVEL